VSSNIKRCLVGSAVALCVSAVTMTTAYAQNQAAADADLQEVVVTGSRVIKNGNDSPTPLTVVTVADMEAVHPGTVADQLNDMPQFVGSASPLSNNAAGSANNGNPNPQSNLLNLRNFGQTRNLILWDGHRVAPTAPNGTVDVNMIPQLLLQRVDVVTGGVSAVYGSDAITGVVNFVTDTKFNGLKINGQAGQSVYHDDPTDALGIAWGSDLFGGRGHLEASYEMRKDSGVDRRSSRPFFQNRPVVQPLPGATTYSLYYYVTHADKAFGGLISPVAGQPTNPMNGMLFCQNGVACPYSHGTPIGSGQWEAGGDGSYFDTGLKAALTEHQFFTRFDYDLTDDLHAYVKASGTYNWTASYSIYQPFQNVSASQNTMTLFANDPYLAPAYQQAMSTAGVTKFNLAKTQADAPREYVENFEHQYSVDMGLEGKFGDGYKWELAFIGDRNEQKARNDASESGLRLAAALDAVPNPSNASQVVCWVSTQPQYASLYPGCVPYNPFGPTSLSPDAERYIFQPVEVVIKTKMYDATGSITGAPFSTWAGPVNTAISGEWRKVGYSQDSSTVINNQFNPLNCAGLRLVSCTPASQEWFQSASASGPEVTNTVREAALEFDAPLLKDKVLVKDLSLNGAARYTNYAISGTAYTWKAGLDWKLNDSLTLRGTRSRDIRAPTLFDLYQPATVGNFNGTDFWTGCSLSGVTACNPPAPGADGKIHNPAVTYTQGNSQLTPEIGKTTTFGFIYTPGWAPGLSMSLDGYIIDLSHAISTQNGNSASVEQACGSSGGASPLCQLIVRPIDCCSYVGNNATVFYASGVNLASMWTEGADLEINYANRFRDMPYSLRVLTSYQPHLVTSNPLTGTIENADFFNGVPIWRSTVQANLNVTENFRISVQEKYRNTMGWVPRQSNGLPALSVTMPRISDVFYTNLNLAYTVRNFWQGQVEIYGNIQNLFDRAPPISAAYNNTQPGIFGVVPGDDVIGRYYTVGFRFRR
jgi:outer membrane receptor protein involved in Fe transport